MIHIPLPVLILQHPQEPSRKDHAISSVQILLDTLSPCHARVGLSWKNLKQAISKFEELTESADAQHFEIPAHWATLYLGTKEHSQSAQKSEKLEPGLYFLDKKGAIKEPDVAAKPISGLIVLDGTWAQAKTLWWRNAWLLKTQRIFLVPKEKSKYGNLRKEPRPECVSTLEAVAETLSFFGLDDTIEATLKKTFENKLKDFKN